MAKGWGYAIDYDKAIAYDLKQIADLESPEQLAVSASIHAKSDVHLDAASWCVWEHGRGVLPTAEIIARGALLGLTVEHISALDRADSQGFLPADFPKVPYTWANMKAAEDRLKELDFLQFIDEKARKSALSKARADLARHKRNKAKFGG